MKYVMFYARKDKALGIKLATVGLLISISGGVLAYFDLKTLGLSFFWFGLALGFAGAITQLSRILDQLSNRRRM